MQSGSDHVTDIIDPEPKIDVYWTPTNVPVTHTANDTGSSGPVTPTPPKHKREIGVNCRRHTPHR